LAKRGASTDEDFIKAALWTNRGLVVIEDIPARLCEGCGEQFFEQEVIQKIEQVVTYPLAKVKQWIRVPVYSLSPPAASCWKTGAGAAQKKRRHSAKASQRNNRSTPLETRPVRDPEGDVSNGPRRGRSLTGSTESRCHPFGGELRAELQAKQATESIQLNQSQREILLCRYCGGETVEELAKSVFWVRGGLIVVENIPARVCRRCRQQFYDDRITERVIGLDGPWSAPGMAKQEVPVPVFSLTDVKERQSKSYHKRKQ
jgi:YgiT-type zinc finger domain-containing protein